MRPENTGLGAGCGGRAWVSHLSSGAYVTSSPADVSFPRQERLPQNIPGPTSARNRDGAEAASTAAGHSGMSGPQFSDLHKSSWSNLSDLSSETPLRGYYYYTLGGSAGATAGAPGTGLPGPGLGGKRFSKGEQPEGRGAGHQASPALKMDANAQHMALPAHVPPAHGSAVLPDKRSTGASVQIVSVNPKSLSFLWEFYHRHFSSKLFHSRTPRPTDEVRLPYSPCYSRPSGWRRRDDSSAASAPWEAFHRDA